MSWKLPDLIDIPSLQMLMDRFHAATGIPVGIIGSDGEILVATGWQEICTRFHRAHPVTAARCRQSDACINTRLTTETYVEYKCRNGLWDLAVPIVIAGEHVATLFLGQFFYDDEEIDGEFFLRQAEEFGFDVPAYMTALRRIPVFTREKVRVIMEFYTSFVTFLVDAGLARCRQVETERTLRVSEEEKALILNSTMDLIVYHDTDMKVLWGNREAVDSAGMRPEEMRGRNCWEIWHQRDDVCPGCPVALARDTGKPQRAEMRAHDGSEWYIRGFPVKDAEGRIKGVVELALDITERRKMEEEIEILNTDLISRAAELEAANRELEAFNYTVSHDLRLPLAGISGYSELLLERCAGSLDEESLGYLRRIDDATRQMDRLIGTMLRFSRISRCDVSRETVDLTAMAKEIGAQLRMDDPGRPVTVSVAEEVTAQGDGQLLRVVLENLLANAWKYTAKEATALIEFGAAETGEGRVFFVRDNGAGFDMTDAEKMFQPFVRLPGVTDYAGHGIGLATAQRIIQRHGGRIWAEGEPGRGATFWFTI
jgi:PAS domain S-box-containing protein